MLRAWMFGFGILIAADVSWLIALQVEKFSMILLVIVQISPFFAALVSAYLAPRKKIMLGTTMAVPAALLVVTLTFVFQLFGKPVDFPGPRGGLMLFTITLLYSALLSALGGVVGYFITKKSMIRMEKKENRQG
jgi:hypothetical protein